MRQEVAFFEKNSSGALVSRLTNDTDQLQNAAAAARFFGVLKKRVGRNEKKHRDQNDPEGDKKHVDFDFKRKDHTRIYK